MIIIHGMDALPRLAAGALDRVARAQPVIVLTGARQTGKSTLVQDLLTGTRRYLTLDDLDVLDQATSDPDSLVERAPFITLDEVQRAPDLLRAVKRAVDKRRTRGRFILTGSANLLLMHRVSETLAGRAAYLTLWPMTRREQLGLGTAGIWSQLLETKDDDWPDLVAGQTVPHEDWRDAARRGGFPSPALELTGEERDTWFTGYARTYLERDVQEITNVSSVVDLRRLMKAAGLRLGQLVNQTELGRDVALPQPTVHRWLNLLEISYQLVRLPAFAMNRTKRLIKAPKAYWGDTGLILHLSGAEPGGVHLENVVLCDLLAWRDAHRRPAEVSYWRTAAGEEVDFVLEVDDKLIPIEVKSTDRPRASDTRHLQSFREEYGKRARPGLLLHTGNAVEWITKDVLAAPWWKVI